ncbi:hypothetical protein ABE10_01470, partial [Bacillus toyonensis]|nr:hypothetical protein [Bacillus toyonensis]
GVQDVRPAVHPDPDAGPQQRLVVAPLGVVDHRLVALFGDEQLHLDPAIARGGHGQQQRLVRNEVRAHDHDLPLRGVEQPEKETEVVLDLEPGARWHDLAVQVAGPSLGPQEVGLGQHLIGLAVPVREEHRVDARDDGAVEADHQVDPVQAALDVLAEVVARVGDVLRADVGDLVVDDEELAVVAEVGPLGVSAERTDGEHEMPVRPHRLQPSDGPAVVRLPAIGPVVQQHPHRDASGGDLFQRAEEIVGRGVGLEDVELDVDVVLRLPDLIGHRVERFLVPRDQVGAVVSGKRQSSQALVHADQRLEPFRGVGAQSPELEVRARVGDVLVDPLLLAPPSSGQTRVADEQEQEDADDRDEVDRQEPGHRRGGSPIARDDDDRGDA